MIAMKKTALLTCALALCLPLAAQAKPVPAIAAAIADTARPEADKARDGARKPAEMLAFAGIKPGAKVGELLPGAGYFTRVIAKTVGDKGAVYVWMAASAPAAWVARLDPLLAAYPNVKLIRGEQIAPPEPVDVIWTTQNYHDLHHTGRDPAATNAAAFAALKPGGIYLVSDHAAKAGSGTADTDSLHRIDPDLVKAEVVKAGFVFAGASKVLANSGDDHTKKVFDLHDATDQFVLKFRKPLK
jgi:predicted methyltransferase